MILYHGTNVDIQSIDLLKGLRYKDFGKGFYLTSARDRKNIQPIHDYDIIIGPIANDGVVLQLTNYREGIYSPEQVAALLQDRFLDQQYFFGTERALSFLHKNNTEAV